MNRVFNLMADPFPQDPDAWKDIGEDIGEDTNGNNKKKAYPIPEAKTILDYRDNPPTSEDNLLGNRFLCREGSMLFVAQSGIGKSSASVQQDILWSIGKPAFGIRPAKPLKILTIQAEDDDGDMHEFVNGIIKTLELTNEEVMLASQNIRYIAHKELTGISFLEELVKPLLEIHKPDILRINPFQAYLGADVTDPAETGKFLRNTLNPLLKKYNCGCIIVHHTPKTTYQNKEEWKQSDWMYACTGCADLTNWARAILVVAAIKGDDDMFAWVAAKRRNRIEWADANGNAVGLRHFKHSDNGAIAWCNVEEADVPVAAGKRGGSDKKYSDNDILENMHMINAIRVGALQRKCKENNGMASATFYELWKVLKVSGKLIESEAGWRKII